MQFICFFFPLKIDIGQENLCFHFTTEGPRTMGTCNPVSGLRPTAFHERVPFIRQPFSTQIIKKNNNNNEICVIQAEHALGDANSSNNNRRRRSQYNSNSYHKHMCSKRPRKKCKKRERKSKSGPVEAEKSTLSCRESWVLSAPSHSHSHSHCPDIVLNAPRNELFAFFLLCFAQLTPLIAHIWRF